MFLADWLSCVAQDGDIVYSYTLRRGINADSHGIAVARLSGVPEHAIAVARVIKDQLEEEQLQRSKKKISKWFTWERQS